MWPFDSSSLGIQLHEQFFEKFLRALTVADISNLIKLRNWAEVLPLFSIKKRKKEGKRERKKGRKNTHKEQHNAVQLRPTLTWPTCFRTPGPVFPGYSYTCRLTPTWLDSTSNRLRLNVDSIQVECSRLVFLASSDVAFNPAKLIFNSFFRSSVNFCGLRFRRFILISWQHLSISPRDCNCRFPVILEILDSWETQMWFLDNSLKEMNLFTSFQNISFNINRWNRVLVISK